MLRNNKGTKITKTATQALKILWEKGIFRNWVKITNVVEELSKKGYHFPSTNIDKALQRAKYLTRRGKRGSYEYIQKYPFTKEEKYEKPKKNN